MGLHEWSIGGVLLSPLLAYVVMALFATGVLRLVIQRAGLNQWIWHEALFDSALYVCVLAGCVYLLGR